MNFYRYKANIPGNVRYGNWEYKGTIIAISGVLAFVIEFFNGSIYSATYLLLMMLLIGWFFSRGFNKWLAVFISVVFAASGAVTWYYYSLPTVALVVCAIYTIFHLVVIAFSNIIDELQGE